jgi:hypothetical protein
MQDIKLAQKITLDLKREILGVGVEVAVIE